MNPGKQWEIKQNEIMILLVIISEILPLPNLIIDSMMKK